MVSISRFKVGDIVRDTSDGDLVEIIGIYPRPPLPTVIIIKSLELGVTYDALDIDLENITEEE